jgi:hypothetical protein
MSNCTIQNLQRIAYNPLTACHAKWKRPSVSCCTAWERTALSVIDFLFLNPSIFLLNGCISLRNKISSCWNQKSSASLIKESLFDETRPFRFRVFKKILTNLVEVEKNRSNFSSSMADSVLFLIEKDVSKNFSSQKKFFLHAVHLLGDHLSLLLFAAMMTDYHEAIPPLVSKVNVNGVDRRGDTPLHMAARGISSKKSVELLLSLGADRNILNASDQTPLMLAENLGNKEVAAALRV